MKDTQGKVSDIDQVIELWKELKKRTKNVISMKVDREHLKVDKLYGINK